MVIETMIHTINKKHLEDKIAELIEWNKTHERNHSTLTVSNIIDSLKLVLEEIKELEVLTNDDVFNILNTTNYLYHNIPWFVKYLSDNNYIIIKNPNK